MIPRSGMPVRRIIEAAHVEFDGAGYITVPRPNGTTAYLDATYFEEPSPAFEGENPAIVSIDGASTRFLRPLITTEPNDVNAVDNVATVSGEPLTIGMHDGNVVKVEVVPSTTSTDAGSPVQLTAISSGGLSGEEFTYRWTFGDGTSGEGEAISHTFGGSGTYEVRVTASGTAESGGESGPVDIIVGNPPTTAQPGATTAPEPKQKGRKPAGANGKGGEGRGGKGPKPTPAGGGKRGSGGQAGPAQRGKSREGPAVSSGSSESGAPATSAPPPEISATSAPPTPTPIPEEPTTPAPEAPVPEAAAPTEQAASRTTSSQGELVEGRLVGDDLGPAALEEAVGGSSPGQGTRSAAGAVGGGGVGVPVVALMVVGLLAGGALFEWRRGRPSR